MKDRRLLLAVVYITLLSLLSVLCVWMQLICSVSETHRNTSELFR